MTLDTIVAASPDQVSCDLGGEAAILNLKTGVYYGLDPVGARIWSLIAQPTPVAAVRDAILAEYEVDVVTAERDLSDLMSKFSAAGLIVVSAIQPERREPVTPDRSLLGAMRALIRTRLLSLSSAVSSNPLGGAAATKTDHMA